MSSKVEASKLEFTAGAQLHKALHQSRKSYPRKTLPGALPVLAPIKSNTVYDENSRMDEEDLEECDLQDHLHAVRSLPDEPVQFDTKPSISISEADDIHTSLAQRIQHNRKERHDTAMQELKNDLTIVQAKIEQQIEERGRSLLSYLESDGQEMDRLLAPLLDDSYLVTRDAFILDAVWESVSAHAPVREAHILQFDKEIKAIETRRVGHVGGLLKEYGKTLRTIGYLMAPDVDRLLDTEAQILNSRLIENRQVLIDLISRLRIVDVEALHRRKTLWDRRVETWHRIKTAFIMTAFSKFISRDEVLIGNLQQIADILARELSLLKSTRSDLLQKCRQFFDSAYTNSRMDELAYGFHTYNQRLTNVHKSQVSKLRDVIEDFLQQTSTVVHQLRRDFEASGVFRNSPFGLAELIARECLPQIEERRAHLEAVADSLDATFQNRCQTDTSLFNSLETMFRGIGQAWQSFEAGLHTARGFVDKSIAKCQSDYDNKRQAMELDFKAAVDVLRQESLESFLATSLDKVYNILNNIAKSYDDFANEASNVVNEITPQTKTVIGEYGQALCKLLQATTYVVENRKKSGKSKKGVDGTATPGLESSSGSVYATIDLKNVLYKASKTGTQYVFTRFEEPKSDIKPTSSVSSARERLEIAKARNPFESVVISSAVSDGFQIEQQPPLYLIQTHVREVLIEQQDELMASLTDLCADYIQRTRSEVESNLEMQKHFHVARYQQVEEDTHNVRAAELVSHRTWIARHVAGTTERLDLEKKRFQDIKQNHRQRDNGFQQEMQDVRHKIETAETTTAVNDCKSSADQLTHQFQQSSKMALREYRSSLDSALNSLREANAYLRKSFKTFSEGGNFSAMEIEQYKVTLEALRIAINDAESEVLSELDGIETLHANVAMEQFASIATVTQIVSKDLTFYEASKASFVTLSLHTKAEVEKSNLQCGEIEKELVRAAGLLQNKSVQVTNDTIFEVMNKLNSLIQARVTYLQCSAIAPAGVVEGASSAVKRLKPAPLASSASSAKPQSGRLTTAINEKNYDRVASSRVVLEAWEPGPIETFSGVVMRAIIAARATIMSLCPAYYDTFKGGSRPTRCLHFIKENPQLYMNFIQDQLKNIRIQLDNYKNECVAELGRQIVRTTTLFAAFPDLLMHNAFDSASIAPLQNGALSDVLLSQVAAIKTRLDALLSSLRPHLGHPDNATQLAQVTAGLTACTTDWNNSVAQFVSAFHKEHAAKLNAVAKDCDDLTVKTLQIVDNAVLRSEVRVVGVIPPPKTKRELLLEQQAAANGVPIQPQESEESTNPRPREQIEHSSLPAISLDLSLSTQSFKYASKSQPIKCTRTELSECTIAARNKVFADISSQYQELITNVRKMVTIQTTAAEIADKSWREAVQALTKPFS